ncbi:hypothetical protein P3T36_007095 [Kitasatospora sp. MAP12-15]|uniref:hypothetical protein n=1 Tax=unclassified Kitasatospora TaxID=2633591 RepID=UPI002473675D|nr:hypothetical protein [Kitasatospora sp. MAP12-44]MDH6108158.1 hypothetical protein [Kitasatospora sp. MAP12-44]
MSALRGVSAPNRRLFLQTLLLPPLRESGPPAIEADRRNAARLLPSATPAEVPR